MKEAKEIAHSRCSKSMHKEIVKVAAQEDISIVDAYDLVISMGISKYATRN